jgi:hypothetical protein
MLPNPGSKYIPFSPNFSLYFQSAIILFNLPRIVMKAASKHAFLKIMFSLPCPGLAHEFRPGLRPGVKTFVAFDA